MMRLRIYEDGGTKVKRLKSSGFFGDLLVGGERDARPK